MNEETEQEWFERILRSTTIPHEWIPNEYFKWFLATCRSMAKRIDTLRQLRKELIREIISWPEVKGMKLTVEQAKLLDVCRFCKIPIFDYPSFRFRDDNDNYEFCCNKCYERKQCDYYSAGEGI